MSMTRNYNFVKEILAFPCASPSPIIWMATFAPAAIPALIEFASFGCRDIVKFRAGVGTACGRLIKAAARQGWGPLETTAAKTWFKFSLPLERLLYWWFVADLLTDTDARWTSLAYKMSPCDPQQEGASWEIEYLAPGLVLPDTPTIVGGAIRNSQGTPGIAWPTGAVVPNGWYFACAFSVTLKPFHTGGQISPHIWLHSQRFGGFDWPAERYPKGYPDQAIKMNYVMQTRAPEGPGATVYDYYCMTDALSWVTDITATCSASPLPIISWSLSPLACLQDLSTTEVPNPAGRNPASRQPTIFDPFLKTPIRPTPRGPPG